MDIGTQMVKVCHIKEAGHGKQHMTAAQSSASSSSSTEPAVVVMWGQSSQLVMKGEHLSLCPHPIQHLPMVLLQQCHLAILPCTCDPNLSLLCSPELHRAHPAVDNHPKWFFF